MSKYFLISKNLGQKFVEYKGNATRLATRSFPYTVDEVVVGIKGVADKTRKITTFRDSKGNILERAFDYFDKPYKNKIYKHADYIIGDDKFVKSTTIKEFSLKRDIMGVYKSYQEKFKKLDIPTTLWESEKILTNHVSEDINTGKKVISQVKIENIKQPQKELHTFIEYPHIINGKKENCDIKFLSYRVNTKLDKVIENTITAQGVKIPQKDSFLRYRAVDTESMKKPITKRFIKERKLEKLKLNINTQYTPKADESSLIAIYTDYDGTVNYNKMHMFKSKSRLVSVARHEVEHAWQYYLRARHTGGTNQRNMEIAKKYGSLKTKALNKEAERCTKAIDNYTPYQVDFKKYHNNYIEVKARKAGLKARNQYDKEGKIIRKSFPYIPEEFL